MKTNPLSVALSVSIVAFSFICSFVSAQKIGDGKRANIWYFGRGAGVDFNSGSPVAIMDNNMSTDGTSSSICDNNGDLLFYTDGDTVWNKEHEVMPNGFIHGSYGGTSTYILPMPGNPYIYYIINHNNPGPPTDIIKYHTVDIRLDGGKGDVTFSSAPLRKNASTSILVVPHANGQDYWILILARSYSVDAYHLSATGLDTISVVSQDVFPRNGVMAWDISPDYKKIAVSFVSNSSAYHYGVHVYDFNNATGLVSNNTVELAENDIWCLQFSPDGSRLYGGHFDPGEVFQWNLKAGSSTDIANSKCLVGASCVAVERMQTGPDGKIYVVSNAYNAYLHCISNPNGLGTACGFQYAHVSLQGRMAVMSLPGFPRDFLMKNGQSVATSASPSFNRHLIFRFIQILLTQKFTSHCPKCLPGKMPRWKW